MGLEITLNKQGILQHSIMSENLTGSNKDSLLYCWAENCSSYKTQKKIQASYVR